MAETLLLIADLLKRLTALEAENAPLQAEITYLQAENAQLEAENADLHRRLGMNSNSHKPPSSDGYQKKRIRSALPKGKTRCREQVGYKGKTLRRVEKADKEVVHLPKQCRVCGREITAEERYTVVSKRQAFDLPEPKLEVTEHCLGEVECCGQKQCGEYPAWVKRALQYGPGVRALVTKLSVDHKMLLKQLNMLSADLYGYALNSETVESVLEEGYRLAEPVEEAVCLRLQEAEVVHFDETGLRVAGKREWLHTACDEWDIVLFVHEKRREKASRIEASVLKDFSDWGIHDFFPVYFKFEQCQHVCQAHVLRELQELVENSSAWAEKMRALLLELYAALRPISKEERTRVRRRYRRILSQAEREEVPSESKVGQGRSKSTPGRNLLRRLKAQEGAVLALDFIEGVPFTNSQAERAISLAKVKREVNGCFRTQNGANLYARLRRSSLFPASKSAMCSLFLAQPVRYQPVSLLEG